jgi:hypothetical protein
MDEMKNKAKQAMSGDKGDDAVDKAAKMADDKTGDKYSDEVDKGADAIKNKMDDKEQ